MKKTAIILSFVLSSFIILSCAKDNPNNPSNNNNNNISLSERAGTYNGTISSMGMNLVMTLDNTGTITSLMVNGNDSLDPANPIKFDPNSKETVFGPFTATVKMNVNSQVISQSAKIKVTFKSGTDKTQGATVDIDMSTGNAFNPTMNADLQYQAS
ncbi:hypothetical protein BFL38_10450 [Brachyspira hampsonii]|uniref:Lipocalin-like domain-containing protein n=1 Tax=Brachyspira hampsonii TaxID=1287055 RepID=A0A1E5NI80_9SPIR|nr:hypothetical protein [Brachyspira hampsonii]OEJ15871.1 hypothetical protein BFL38_10450 [Brachyspira hampsonii]